LFWYFFFSSVSAIWYQLLQFGIYVLSLQLFWYFFFSLVSAIWYQLLQFGIWVKFLQKIKNIKKNWSDILSSASAKSGISTFLQLLQFGISVLSLQLFSYFFFSSVSAIWYLRSVSAKIKNLEWYFVFRFCKIWYFNCPSASAIWYFCLSLQLFWYLIFSSVSAIWYQLLQFGISVLSLQLFWYFVFSSVSTIWYLS